MTDITSIEQAAIDAKRDLYAEWELENEQEHERKILQYKHEAEIKREREKCAKYQEAMAAKARLIADRLLGQIRNRFNF